LLLSGIPVRIIKHRRRVGGEFATGIDVFWREEEPWVVLQLPTGRRASIPAAWTDLPLDQFDVNEDRPEILPAGLLELARHCRGLQSTRGTRRPRKNPPGKR
jgi:hypothetical protein